MASLLTALVGSVFGYEHHSREISAMIAEPLTADITEQLKGVDYKRSGTTISVGDDKLEVFPFLENYGVQDSEHILGVRFDIHVDGKKDDRLTFGVVGNGKSRDTAQRNAVHHWWAAFAVPLITSIAHQNTDFTQSPYMAYFGSTVVRGEPPGGWIADSKERHQKLTTALIAILGKEPGVKAIDLKVLVDSAGQLGGECRVNGRVSQEVLEGLRKLAWPTSDVGYMLYQVYILKHKSEG